MSNFFNKYSCILCKYNKYNKNGDECWNHMEKDEYGYPIGKCNSLSNIYYGKIVKHFPFKQIDFLKSEIVYKKEEKYYKEMDSKYGDCALEDDDMKFIWGVKSWDDLTGHDANMMTMNDIDIIYDKNSKQYLLGIETAYCFKNYESECEYLKECLNAFTKYMNDNNLDTNKHFELFMANVSTEIKADNIEELYTNFKIFVNGYCSLGDDNIQ